MIYLWWPFPTVMGFDALNALAPAFGITATIGGGGAVPDATYGAIFQISDGVAPPTGQYIPAATRINLGNNDRIYIVGHCAAGIASLIGEYASYPVNMGLGEAGTPFQYTKFRIPPAMNISDFLGVLRKFCGPFLPPVVPGQDNFVFQVDYRENVVRIYTQQAIAVTNTTIVGGNLTLSNAERQFVMGQHVDKYSGEAKAAKEFEKTANALAYGLRDRFGATGACTGAVILWACFSVKAKGSDKSLAKRLKECLCAPALGLNGVKVYGCTGKASVQAMSTRHGPVAGMTLKVKDKGDTWNVAEIGSNLQEAHLN